MAGDIQQVKAEIAACERKISECEDEVAKNEAAQEALTTRTDAQGVRTPRRRLSAVATANLAYLRTEKEQLRAKEQQLRTEKNKLRTKEEKLRTKEARLEGAGWPLLQSSAHILLLVAARLSCVSALTLSAGKVAKVALSPSEMGQVHVWSEFQYGVEVPRYFCNRPSVSPPLAIPAVLVSPIFGRYLDVMAAPLAALGEVPLESECARQLCLLMPNRFEVEVERQDAFLGKLEEMLSISVAGFSPAGGSTSRSDGGIQARIHGLLIMLLLIEMKNELSLGDSEPTFQSLRFTELKLELPALAALRDADACPALLLEVVGPHLRVSALAWMPSGHVLCEPLTPLLHMLPLTGQPRQLDALVQALAALRLALDELRLHYDTLLAQLPPAPAAGAAVPSAAAAALPYPLRDAAVFADVAHLSPGKLLYEATHVASGARVCVKFAPRAYAVDVHAAWAAAGLAPALLEHRVLPGSVHMVVMELLSANDGWCMLSDSGIRPGGAFVAAERAAAAAAALDALQRAHALRLPCGSCAVHGDCRDVNVLVRRAPTPGAGGDGDDSSGGDFHIRFLDFDWAGPLGLARYPPYMSDVVSWPPGAAAGAAITQAHDLTLLTASASKVHLA